MRVFSLLFALPVFVTGFVADKKENFPIKISIQLQKPETDLLCQK
jgi:hypothetical protein